jgi:hypothetical protein
MSKDLYAQRGWLVAAMDQLAGIKDAEKLHAKAHSTIRNRPTWVKDKTVASFSQWIETRTGKLEKLAK